LLLLSSPARAWSPVRVLLDENIPHDLIPHFAGHDVSTVQGLGWAGVKNGDLLERARSTIDVFVTMDRKLEKQHGLSVLSFGVVVVLARSNRMADLLPLTTALREAVARISPGKVEHVGARGAA
jgi:uncharacterized protein DUF5615